MKSKSGYTKFLVPVLAAGLIVSFSVPAFAAGNVKRGKRQYDQW